MRLVFAGTPDAAVPALLRLLASPHDVAAVLTRPDARAGRGRKSVASAVAQVASDRGLRLLQPASASDPDLLAQLTELSPDCCPIVAYGGLIPASLLALPKHGWVNLHFSLLPAWRGAAPVQHAVLRGDEVTGASTFRLDEGLDTGPVFGAVTETVLATDTSGELLRRLAISGAELLLQTLDGIESGKLRPVPQSSVDVSLAPKVTVDDARVRWDVPAFHIDRQIRACTPSPGAWTTFRDERLKVLPITALADEVAPSNDAVLRPGELSVARAEVRVGTASHQVRLGQVQPQGRRVMQAADWARGLRVLPGETLL
ncbi:MAG TPA: methionyl-tRNA formyltransferase [Actinomycetes bacterium]|nr:methionyl-tRNA formyltransferase [Actinomycetes bacterium]